MKLEQAARALLAHWDTPIWKDVKPTADLMAALREALKPTREGKYYYKDNACTADNADSPDCICWHDEALAEQAEQEPVIECDCETSISSDGSRLTKCGSDQMRRAVEQGHAFCKQQAEQEPAELKECRHCGFLCKPNPNESRKWYPLEQPVSQEPKSDCPCCGAKSSVLPMAFCRECKSEFWPPQPVRTKDPCNPLQDLTDDEIMKINVDTAGIVPTCDRQFHFARAVIAADRSKNGIV